MQGICPWGDHPFEYEPQYGKLKTYCSKQHAWKANAARGKARREQMQERTCARCRKLKSSSEFGGPTNPYCRPCHTEYERERARNGRKQDPAYTRKLNLRRYGLTQETFARILAAQEGRCAICRTSEPGGQGWHVDHDHTCCNTRKISCGQCIRGVLCTRCNIGIGNFRDDPAIIQAAIEYIAAYRRRRAAMTADKIGGYVHVQVLG